MKYFGHEIKEYNAEVVGEGEDTAIMSSDLLRGYDIDEFGSSGGVSWGSPDIPCMSYTLRLSGEDGETMDIKVTVRKEYPLDDRNDLKLVKKTKRFCGMTFADYSLELPDGEIIKVMRTEIAEQGKS